MQHAIGSVPFLYRAIGSTWVPPEGVYKHLPFKGRFTVEVEHGRRFELLSDGYQVENELFWRGYGGSWERKSLSLWRELAKDAAYIADVGANTGVFALAAQALNPAATVIAVEPSPRVFARLQKNIAINGFPIVAERVAASDRTAELTFYDFEGDHQYSASLEPSMGGTIETSVQAETLDSILERRGFPRLDLMKLDVERHEPSALRGMRNYIERSFPIILIEVLDDECRAGVEQPCMD